MLNLRVAIKVAGYLVKMFLCRKQLSNKLLTVCSAHFLNMLLPLFILFIGCVSGPEISLHEFCCVVCVIAMCLSTH